MQLFNQLFRGKIRGKIKKQRADGFTVSENNDIC